MGTQQHLDPMQLRHFVVVDGNQSEFAQSFTLHAVMHNVTQTIELLPCCQLLFCLLDGGCHSEAETAATVYLNSEAYRA